MRNSMRSFFAFERDAGWCEALGGNRRTRRGAAAVKSQKVGADGNSRYRVKMYWHLRASVLGEEEWYRGTLNLTLSSL